MREVLGLLRRHDNWRLERRDPYEEISDLRLLTLEQNREVIDRLAKLPSDDLVDRLEAVENRLRESFRRGGETNRLVLDNLTIMREQLTQALNKQSFGQGWMHPSGALPKGDLDEAKETFSKSTQRLLDFLDKEGWQVTRHLKIPRADRVQYQPVVSVWFKKQSVYVASHHGKTKPAFNHARSLFIDTRGMSGEAFLKAIERYTESVDLPVDRAELVAAGDEQSVWERYGMKQTPGWAPPSWALKRRYLGER